jgi:hypothetical protein
MKSCCDRHSGESCNPATLIFKPLDPGLRRGDDNIHSRHSGGCRNPEIMVPTTLDHDVRRGDDNTYSRHSGAGRNPETLILSHWTPAFAGVTAGGKEMEL